MVMLPCYGLCLRDVLMAGGAGKAPPQAQPDPHARLSHAARISRRQQPCDGRCVASHACRRLACCGAGGAAGTAAPGARSCCTTRRRARCRASGTRTGPRTTGRTRARRATLRPRPGCARACLPGSRDAMFCARALVREWTQLCCCRSSGRWGRREQCRGGGALEMPLACQTPLCQLWRRALSGGGARALPGVS